MIRLSRLALAIAAGAFLAGASEQQKSASPAVFRLPFEAYTLPNGLKVVLSIDRSTPTVAVDVEYHVGAKDEPPNRTGLAHLFEHVMLTGSAHVPSGLFDKLTQGVGGFSNASTGDDATDYFETVPSNYLETALWLESDRMGFLLDALDLARINTQREIVRNEGLQHGEPSLDSVVLQAIYPPSHPYSRIRSNSLGDLSAVSAEDVRNFGRSYYTPDNASLAIVGDFDILQAKMWVTKYFGDIPRGRGVPAPALVPVTLDKEKRLVFEDSGPDTQLYIVWPTVGQKQNDRFALEVLAAIASDPRTTRLTSGLVSDRPVAATVSAYQASRENAGEFGLTITPLPGHSLTELEPAVDAILDNLKTAGPTMEEILEATAGRELAFLLPLQSSLAKSRRLAWSLLIHDDAGYFEPEYQARLNVTPGDVRRVASTYLTRGRVVVSVVPVRKLVAHDPTAEAGRGPNRQ